MHEHAEPETINGIKVYDREFVMREFAPLNEHEIREYYVTVGSSSEIDLMIGAVFAEHLLGRLAEIRELVGAPDRCTFVRGDNLLCGEPEILHSREHPDNNHPFTPESTLAAVKRCGRELLVPIADVLRPFAGPQPGSLYERTLSYAREVALELQCARTERMTDEACYELGMRLHHSPEILADSQRTTDAIKQARGTKGGA